MIVIILSYMLHYILDINTTFLCINTYYNCPYVFTYCNLHYTTSVCICTSHFPVHSLPPPRRILHLFLNMPLNSPCFILILTLSWWHCFLFHGGDRSIHREPSPIPIILTVSRRPQPPAARHLCWACCLLFHNNEQKWVFHPGPASTFLFQVPSPLICTEKASETLPPHDPVSVQTWGFFMYV